jgi:chromosome segregation and condensation protein ScpB
MTPVEIAFLERAVVQLLFVSGRTFSLETLREKLRELFVAEPDAAVRAAASVGGFELLQVLLRAGQRLEKLGLKLNIRAGAVRLTTAEVRPAALRDYFAALHEECSDVRTNADSPDSDDGPLGQNGLEVLACIALKQPVGQTEINGYFTADKRAAVRRLQALGLVDCRRTQETGGRTVWTTTAEFLRRFGLESAEELERMWKSHADSGERFPAAVDW